MGLFSGKKKIFVSSVVYNMAGAIEDRPNFLKTTVIGGVLTTQNQSMGDVISSSYLKGPGMRLRSFAAWARTSGYSSLVGQRAGTINLGRNISTGTVAAQIPAAQGETVHVQSVDLNRADYLYWAEQYILERVPERMNQEWRADFDEEANQITIQFPSSIGVRFTPSGYIGSARYLYATYNLSKGEEAKEIVPGNTEHIGTSPFPGMGDWNLVENTSSPQGVTLYTYIDRVITYSDDRPQETEHSSSSRMETHNVIYRKYERDEYLGTDPADKSRLHSTKHYAYHTQGAGKTSSSTSSTSNEELPGGIIRTTTTYTTTEHYEPARSIRTDTQDVTVKSWTPLKIFIYREGSGRPALDAMFAPSGSVGEFFPYIPLRIWNEFLGPGYHADIYNGSRRALKKATGASLNKINDDISENESLDDIDFAYITFAVPLNVKDESSRRYLFEFFNSVRIAHAVGSNSYNTWKSQWAAANNSMNAWIEWRRHQEENQWTGFGTDEPFLIPYPPLPEIVLRIASSGVPDINFDMSILMNSMDYQTGTGLKKSGAKEGQVWLERGATETFSEKIYDYNNGFSDRVITVEFIDVHRQTTLNQWETIRIGGLTHRNMIYGGKSVDIAGVAALQDTDESGFLVPLHEQIYKSTSLVHRTQMSTACCYVVFNCYEVVQEKWYQTGMFRAFIIIIAIVIAAYTGGAGAGLLGSNASVGATLGFTGTMAIAVGALANAMAAMILMRVITEVSQAVLGDKLGAIVGLIASVIAVQAGTALKNGQSFISSMSALFRADNLLKLTISGMQGVSSYMQATIQEIIESTTQMLSSYEQESLQISQAYEQNVGLGRATLDPFLLDNFSSVLNTTPESLDTFLQRTLMSGSDVADLSQSFISNFSDLTLSTELP